MQLGTSLQEIPRAWREDREVQDGGQQDRSKINETEAGERNGTHSTHDIRKAQAPVRTKLVIQGAIGVDEARIVRLGGCMGPWEFTAALPGPRTRRPLATTDAQGILVSSRSVRGENDAVR